MDDPDSSLPFSERISGYVYSALPDESYIRLLIIQGHSPNSRCKLDCKLITVDLDTNEVPYVAVSYTWGPPLSTPECAELYSTENDVTIRLSNESGCVFESRISRNLYDAITRIHNDKVSCCWADAVCINQENLNEKSVQVGRMGEIYSRASFVACWLGPATDRQVRYLQWFHTNFRIDIREFQKTHEGEVPLMGPTTPTHSGVASFQDEVLRGKDSLFSPEALLILASFYAERSYFTRRWVVQEVALAHSVRFLCGPLEVDLGALQDVAIWCHHNLDAIGRAVEQITQLDPLDRNPFSLQRVVNLCFARPLVRSPDYVVQELALPMIYGTEESPPNPFLLIHYVLERMRSYIATKEQDDIHALLGIFKAALPIGQHQHLLVPDYRQSTEEVFISMTRTLLQGLPYLNVFSSLGHFHLRKQGLPSWIPDYAVGDARNLQNMAYMRYEDEKKSHSQLESHGVFRPFDVHPQRKAEHLSLRTQANELHLFGRKCFVIESCLSIFAKDPFESRDGRQKDRPLEEQYPYVFLLITLLNNFHSNPYHETRIHIFSHIIKEFTVPAINIDSFMVHLYNYYAAWLLVVGQEAPQKANGGQVHALGYSLNELVHYLGKLSGRDDSSSPIRSLDEIRIDSDFDQVYATIAAMNHTLGERRVFITSQGYMGLGPDVVRRGDEVWLLCRGRLPMILRPAEGEARYTILGETYVHGGMHGEFVETGVAGEVQKIVLV